MSWKYAKCADGWFGAFASNLKGDGLSHAWLRRLRPGGIQTPDTMLLLRPLRVGHRTEKDVLWGLLGLYVMLVVRRGTTIAYPRIMSWTNVTPQKLSNMPISPENSAVKTATKYLECLDTILRFTGINIYEPKVGGLYNTLLCWMSGS